jgi:hypothetical protein
MCPLYLEIPSQQILVGTLTTCLTFPASAFTLPCHHMPFRLRCSNRPSAIIHINYHPSIPNHLFHSTLDIPLLRLTSHVHDQQHMACSIIFKCYYPPSLVNRFHYHVSALAIHMPCRSCLSPWIMLLPWWSTLEPIPLILPIHLTLALDASSVQSTAKVIWPK